MLWRIIVKFLLLVKDTGRTGLVCYPFSRRLTLVNLGQTGKVDMFFILGDEFLKGKVRMTSVVLNKKKFTTEQDLVRMFPLVPKKKQNKLRKSFSFSLYFVFFFLFLSISVYFEKYYFDTDK